MKKSLVDQMKSDKKLFEAKQFEKTENIVEPQDIAFSINISSIAKISVEKHIYSDGSYGAQTRIEYNGKEIEKQIKEQVEQQIKDSLKGKVDQALIDEMFKEKAGGNDLYAFPNSFSKYNF